MDYYKYSLYDIWCLGCTSIGMLFSICASVQSSGFFSSLFFFIIGSCHYMSIWYEVSNHRSRSGMGQDKVWHVWLSMDLYRHGKCLYYQMLYTWWRANSNSLQADLIISSLFIKVKASVPQSQGTEKLLKSKWKRKGKKKKFIILFSQRKRLLINLCCKCQSESTQSANISSNKDNLI